MKTRSAVLEKFNVKDKSKNSRMTLISIYFTPSLLSIIYNRQEKNKEPIIPKCNKYFVIRNNELGITIIPVLTLC